MNIIRWFPAVTILFAVSMLFTHYVLVPDGEHSHYIDSYGLKTEMVLTWLTYTFLHSHNNHLLWNVVPTSFFILFIEWSEGWRIALFCIFFTILLIPATFLFVEQIETTSKVEVMRGHGASGIKAASGVFFFLQTARWVSHKFDKSCLTIWLAWLILLLLCAAIIWSIFNFDDTTVSDVGHIAGFISGTLVFLLYQWKMRATNRISDEQGDIEDSLMQ